jgi:hypothetical protein
LATLENWTTPIKKLESLLARNTDTLSINSSTSHTKEQTSIQTTISIFHQALSHLKNAKYNEVLVNVELLAAAVAWFTQGNIRFPSSATELGELLTM